jgi:hypothetical protein
VNVSVLGGGDADAWSAALGRLPDHDVYHRIEYLCASESNGDGTAVAFVAQEHGDLLFHAFMRRAIDHVGDVSVSGWSDLESVYGYSGPLASSADPGFLSRAWAAFAEWCKSEQVVAEFIRFSPLLRNESVGPVEAQVSRDRETVAVRLDVGSDELWKSYGSVQRNMVRKAERHGIVVGEAPVGEGLPRFREVYEETMRRVGADPYFLLSDAYYEALGGLGDALRIFEVRSGDGEIAAAALFLVDGDRLHYHLSGSRETYRDAAPTNLLLHGAATWGRERGLSLFHLGGGRTPGDDDPLFRFKASLSSLRLPFFTGRRVHDSRMYDELCSLWLDRARPETRPPYFLLYRLDIPS